MTDLDNNSLRPDFTGGASTGTDFIPFTSSSDQEDEQYFAVDRKSYHRRFKIIQQGGIVHSFPYALLPVITIDGGKRIDIMFHDFTIEIKGRRLVELHNALNDEVVIFIRESTTGHDHGRDEIFVSSINLLGDTPGA